MSILLWGVLGQVGSMLSLLKYVEIVHNSVGGGSSLFGPIGSFVSIWLDNFAHFGIVVKSALEATLKVKYFKIQENLGFEIFKRGSAKYQEHTYQFLAQMDI